MTTILWHIVLLVLQAIILIVSIILNHKTLIQFRATETIWLDTLLEELKQQPAVILNTEEKKNHE